MNHFTLFLLRFQCSSNNNIQ